VTRATIDNNGYPIPAFRLGTVQVASYDASVAISNAVGTATRLVRIACSTAAHVLISAAPTATTSHSYFPAGHVEIVAVRGGIDKVAAIIAVGSSAGVMTVTELV